MVLPAPTGDRSADFYSNYKPPASMLANILSIVILLACLAALFLIVSKKFEVLASIDVNSLPDEKVSEVKYKLIRDRIYRRLFSWQKTLSFLITPVTKFLSTKFSWLDKASKKLQLLKTVYHKSKTVGGYDANDSQEVSQTPTEKLLTEGSESLENDDLAVAEDRFLAMLKLDSKMVPAYEGLSQIYIKEHEWDQAKDVLICACKLLKQQLHKSKDQDKVETQHKLVNLQHDLCNVYLQLGNKTSSLAVIKEALEIQPNSPKLLDQQLELYIKLGQRLKGEDALDDLKKANPDNNKLEEFDKRLKELEY